MMKTVPADRLYLYPQKPDFLWETIPAMFSQLSSRHAATVHTYILAKKMHNK